MFLQKFLLSALLLFTGAHAFCQDAIPLINSSVLIEEGIKLHEEGKYREAIEVYSRISPSDSNYVFSLYEQALSYKADSQFEKSLRVTEHALTVNQEHRHRPLLLSIQGSLVDNMGDRSRAIRMYDSAIALYPEFDELYANKAVTYIRADKYAEAEKVMQASLLREPFYPAFHYLNGVSAFYQGKPVEAFLSFASYLLIAPNGTYKSKAISMMSSIAKNDNDIVKLVSERKSEPSDAFLVLEQIIASKIALEKGYKTMISMDDQICRQLQVTMEKLEYNENDGSFYMQYYVPFYTKLFADRKFEPFVYRVFAGVDLDPIQSYIKKNKREIQSVVDRTAEYFSEVRSTRELQAAKRSKSTYRYFFDKNGLSHHGPVNGESFEGKWTYIYPAGNIKAAGQMNRQNEKVGEWRYYYRDGRLDGIENYRDGKLHGAGEYYHENGNLLMRGNYVDGERNGTFTFYDKMGAVSAVETYSNGKVQGVKYSYYPSGVLKATEEFVDNVSTGKFEQFYSNGIKRKSGTTANDELTGPYQYYHEDGTLAIEGAYANGKAVGTWKHYYTNGQLKYTENYVNGVLDGEYTEYHDNGKPATSVHKYKKGKITGPVEFFDNEGIRTSSFSFDDGVIKWAKQFDKTGKQIASSEMKGKGMTLELFTRDGFKRLVRNYNGSGQLNGTENSYFPSGVLKETAQYKEGQLEGLQTGYHPNKQKSFDLEFQSGEKHGYYRSYHISGKMNQEGWYQNDLSQGIWQFYNKQGDVTAQTNYRDDEYHGASINYWPGNIRSSETMYDEGVIQSITQYDTTGKKINYVDLKSGSGKFTIVAVNGKKLSEGSYKFNDYDGEYKMFYPDGTLRLQRFYRNGLPDSVYRDYFLNKKISEEGKYVNGKKTGTWTNYNREGTLLSTEEFVDGKLSGKTIYYHPNGKKMLEMDYKNDELHGNLVRYSPQGALMIQQRFNEGYLRAYTYAGKDGKLVPEIELPGGNGKVECFYPNGNKSLVAEYRDNLAHGEETLYHDNGKIWEHNVREYGQLTESTEYFADGKMESTYSFKNGERHGAFKEYHPNGSVKREGQYYDGDFHGKIKHYDASGKLTQTITYYYGQMLEVKK